MPPGRTVDAQRLLAHQKGHPVVVEELVIHAEGAGVIRRHLLHIAQKSAGLEQTAEIRIRILHERGLNVVIGFHTVSSLTKKQAVQFPAQPVVQY